MTRQEKRHLIRQMKKIQKDVRSSWIMETDGAMNQATLIRIVATCPRPMIAKAYAVAIVESGLTGAIDWVDVGKALQTRFRMIPSIVDLTKRAAWKEIIAARRRRGPVRKRTPGGAYDRADAACRRSWSILGSLLSWSIVVGLAVLGWVFAWFAIGWVATMAETWIRGAI